MEGRWIGYIRFEVMLVNGLCFVFIFDVLCLWGWKICVGLEDGGVLVLVLFFCGGLVGWRVFVVLVFWKVLLVIF